MSIDKDGLASLLERVREAKGPDREVDQAIDAWLWRSNRKHHGELDVLPQFSASIDASLALVERLLPGWTIAHMSQQDDKTWFCELREGFLTSYNRVVMSETGYGKQRPMTLPLAILQALFSALKEVR